MAQFEMWLKSCMWVAKLELDYVRLKFGIPQKPWRNSEHGRKKLCAEVVRPEVNEGTLLRNGWRDICEGGLQPDFRKPVCDCKWVWCSRDPPDTEEDEQEVLNLASDLYLRKAEDTFRYRKLSPVTTNAASPSPKSSWRSDDLLAGIGIFPLHEGRARVKEKC